jgi:hypothetical protein
VVHEDDEFAHAGGQGHEWLFAGGAQTRIKGFENTIMTDGAQSRHVKSAAEKVPQRLTSD